MTRDETKTFLQGVEAIFPNAFKDMSDNEKIYNIRVWHDLLVRYKAETISAAWREHLAESSFAPKPADIIRQAKRIVEHNRNAGAYNALPAPKGLSDPLTPEEQEEKVQEARRRLRGMF